MKTIMRTSMNYNKGFTLIEFLIVVALIGMAAAILIPVLSGGGQAEKERRVQGDIASLVGGAIEWKSASTSFSGVNCNTIANTYATVNFTTCSGQNPFGGNYTMSASGQNLIITATGLPTESCTKILRNFQTTNQTATCSGGTLSVTVTPT